MFVLAKWYLDLVTNEGVVIVAYAARLQWERLRLGYSSVLRSVPGQPADETTCFAHVDQPLNEGDRVTWRERSLGVTGRWDRLAAPIQETLLHTSAGDIRWNCVMPSSRANIALNDACHRGIGYVEQLTLSTPPWDLPFNTLRWGRYASLAHSTVWIEWAGSDTRRLVWLDGTEQPGATLEDDGIRGLRNQTRLEFGAPRDLCARPALARLMDHLPQFSRPIAGRAAAMFEHKMVAPSRLIVAGTSVDSGWSIFEEVKW